MGSSAIQLWRERGRRFQQAGVRPVLFAEHVSHIRFGDHLPDDADCDWRARCEMTATLWIAGRSRSKTMTLKVSVCRDRMMVALLLAILGFAGCSRSPEAKRSATIIRRSEEHTS